MTRALPLLTLVFPLLASVGAAAAEPTPTDWAQAVIAGKAVGWSPSLKQVAVREESLGTAMSDFRVVFLQPHGERADALEVMHEVYGEQGEDEYKSSHETWEAAIAEAGPKLATRLTEGAFMDLPRVPWAKRGALRGFKFTWKNNHLYAAVGKGQAVAVAEAPERNGEYQKPVPTALFVLPGQPVAVLAIQWRPKKGEMFTIKEDQLLPVVLPEAPLPAAPPPAAHP